MKRISTDIRQKIRDDVNNGMSHRDVAEKYGVSASSVSMIAKERIETVQSHVDAIVHHKQLLERLIKDEEQKLEALRAQYSDLIDRLKSCV